MQNLVTTALVDTFSYKDKNLILGKWCLRELYKSQKKYLISELPYHWAKKNKVKKDYEYLKEYYYRAISNFSVSLNNYHQVDKSERYWHIIIGPFFVNFIPLIWDRWETIKNLNEDEFKTIVLIDKKSFPVFEDFKDFFTSFNDHYWNHLIYLDVIKVLKDKNFTYQTKKFNYFKNSTYKEGGQFLSKIGNLINPFFKNNNFLLYDLAFKKYDYLKLNLYLKQIPTINSNLDRKIFQDTPLKRDNLQVKIQAKNQFENFCNNLIIKNLPKSYVENYTSLKTYIDKIELNPQKIITSFAHINNDTFKIWSAEQVLKGKKLIITDHGGYIDESSHFYSMEKYSDLYLKWNKTDPSLFLSTKQVPPNLFLAKRKILKSTDLGKNILFLTNNTHLYAYRIGASPISTLMVDEQDAWIGFLKRIIPENKSRFKVRIHPSDNWNFKKIFLENFKKDLLSKKKKLRQDIKFSKLIINTTLQTTFVESMKSGVPTIVITSGFTVVVPRPIKQIIKKLKASNIFFDDFDKAFDHINKILDDPLFWWNSNHMQKIRDEFASCCSLETDNNFSFWVKTLKKI